MARHKVYASMWADFIDGCGREVSVSSRRKIKDITIALNADCNGKMNVDGYIRMKYDDATDTVTLEINTPKYFVNVRSCKFIND
jgi:hypothetical protein